MTHETMSRGLGVLSLVAFVGCATTEPLRTQTQLDERGRTWVTLDATITLARAAPRFSHTARDYVYLAPVETNDAGVRRHYLWLGLGTTVDRGWPWAAPTEAVTLLLTLDGTPIALPLSAWDRDPGGALYRTAAPVYQVQRASVSLDELERVTTAAQVGVQVVGSDGSATRYDLWDGEWSDWVSFVDNGR